MKLKIIFTALFVFSCAQSEEEPQVSAHEKIYIQPSQVSISEHGIFVNMGNEWFPAESIHMDVSGMYVSWVEKFDSSWYCSLGHRNEWWRQKCKICEREIGK